MQSNVSVVLTLARFEDNWSLEPRGSGGSNSATEGALLNYQRGEPCKGTHGNLCITVTFQRAGELMRIICNYWFYLTIRRYQ